MAKLPKTSPFEYLLNRFESAAQSDSPAMALYGDKRKDVLAYVRAMTELAEARGTLLVCHRTGSHTHTGKAIGRIHAAQAIVDALDAKVRSPEIATPSLL